MSWLTYQNFLYSHTNYHFMFNDSIHCYCAGKNRTYKIEYELARNVIIKILQTYSGCYIGARYVDRWIPNEVQENVFNFST